MKLSEIIPLFEKFGLSEQYVRLALLAGNNGFESLKLLLEMRWNDMNQELGG